MSGHPGPRKDLAYERLVESAPDAIVLVDRAGLIRLVNRQTEVLFGYERAELLGQAVEMLIPTRFAANHPSLRQGYFANPSVRAMGAGLELAARRKDGSEFPVDISLSPIETDEGTMVSAAVRDITERKRAEAKFQGLLESAPDAIVVVGEDGLIRLVNRQTEVLFGYERAELVGQAVEMLIPTRFAANHPSLRQGYFANPSARAMGAGLELAARRKDGSEFPVDISLSPLETEEGTLVSAAVRDVTERKRLESELEAARDQALEASRLKSAFLANMSHEIRTPMNAVIGMTGLLIDSELSSEQRGYAEAVRSAGEGLLQIINDILDFSRIEAGKLRLEIMDFDVKVLVDEVVDLLAGKARSKGLDLVTFLDGLDDIDSTLVRGDPGRVRQVLTNLVDNAIKFSDRGRVVINVGVTSRSPETTTFRFEVADDGIGIPEDFRDLLFEPFEQSDPSTTRRHGGTGLGLPISRELVETMGGLIGFETSPDGSTFWFELPFLPSHTRPAEQRPPYGVEPARADRHRVRLLVAEDNPVNQLVAVAMLKKIGYRADVVANGAEALEAMTRVPYAAILMDCQMPELDGFAATRCIRDRETEGHRTPVIAMTAGAMKADRDQCMAADMDDYLSKPVRLEALESVLARWVRVPAPDDDD